MSFYFFFRHLCTFSSLSTLPSSCIAIAICTTVVHSFCYCRTDFGGSSWNIIRNDHYNYDYFYCIEQCKDKNNVLKLILYYTLHAGHPNALAICTNISFILLCNGTLSTHSMYMLLQVAASHGTKSPNTTYNYR